MTSAVCDQCWGSGRRDKPWLSLRALQGKDDAVEALIQVGEAMLTVWWDDVRRGKEDGWDEMEDVWKKAVAHVKASLQETKK